MKSQRKIPALIVASILVATATWFVQPLREIDGAFAASDGDPEPAIGAAQEAVGPVAADRESVSVEVYQSVSREPVMDTLVPLLGTDKKDSDRLVCVNKALQKAGLPTIDETSRIRMADLDAYRAIVDAAEAAVDRADDKWSGRAVALTQTLADDLRKRLAAGQTSGLPFAGKDNPLSRRHPHEAIRQVLAGGRSFVVRVSPADCPRLAELGEAYDAEVAKRAHDYNTLVRSLVIANVGK